MTDNDQRPGEPGSARAELQGQIDTVGELVAGLVRRLEARARTQGDVDGRMVAVARTELQKGFLALRRAADTSAKEF